MRAVHWGIVLMAALGSTLARSEGTIVGSVVDRGSQKPLIGVNITVKGTTLGTSTDEFGEFRIDGVPAGLVQLRVSLVGYVAQTVTMSVDGDRANTIGIALSPAIIPGPPITVTATRAKDRETPASFTTMDRQTIRERYTTQDIPVLLSELPSSTSYSESGSNIGYTYLNIRGFDSRRIAVMVNGIPQNDPEDHNVYWLDFPDIAGTLEDIQVQRGAGSAFYGPPAIGGSVNLATTNFGHDRALAFSAGAGSFNTRKYSASFSSGLIDSQYAIYGRLSKIMSSGYRDRAWVDFNSYFLGAIRYDENMTTQFDFYGGPIADHLAYYGIPKSEIGDPVLRKENPILRDEEVENFSQPHAELFNEWRLDSLLTLNNTFFLVFGDGFFDYDGSWAPYSYYRITPQYGFTVTGNPDSLYLPGALIRANVTNRQFGWLPRVTWSHEGGTLVAGAEVRLHRSDHWGRLQWAQQLPPDVPWDYRYYAFKAAKDIVSIYFQELYKLENDLSLMVDLQYAYNRYRLYDEKYLNTNFSVPYNFLNPRAGINYNFDQRWNGYFSIAYTSREPRLTNLYDAAEASTPSIEGHVTPQFALNSDGSYDFNAPLVKPEALLDLELGIRYSSAETQATANLYWMEFSNEIVKSGRVDRFGQPITGNAERTRHIGLELSGKTVLAEGLELSGNATFSRNRFVRSVDFTSGTGAALNGNPIAGFPDVLGNLRLTYRTEQFTCSVSARYVGRQYTDNFKTADHSVDPYGVCDAWASYTFPELLSKVSVEAKLQVNNLFNRLYAAYGEGDEFFVAAERNAFFNLSITI